MRVKTWAGSVATDSAARAIAAGAEERADDGLLDISVLEHLILHPATPETANHAAKPPVNGVSATDAEFLDWAAHQLGLGNNSQRLAARIMFLRVISADRALHPVRDLTEEVDDD
jgi:hypothetical protein